MTDKLRAAAEEAIGAMVRAAITGHADALDGYAEALRAALAEQDAEPVALFSPGKWTLLLTGKNHGLVGQFGDRFDGHPKYYDRVDVYTASPRREWQSLTQEELEAALGLTEHTDLESATNLIVAARAIEQALREKNHDPR